VLISIWTAPLNVVRSGATTLWHFDAAERAPSTTSIWIRQTRIGACYLGRAGHIPAHEQSR
jgi:hypothetical protein